MAGDRKIAGREVARFAIDIRVGRVRRRAIAVPDKWSLPPIHLAVQNPAYKPTRSRFVDHQLASMHHQRTQKRPCDHPVNSSHPRVIQLVFRANWGRQGLICRLVLDRAGRESFRW
jgi:hypothetical protein